MNVAINRAAQIGEWIGERTNPLLVKEVRQSLKSRQFIFSFGLVLLACWLISVAGMLLSGGQSAMQVAANGREFFYAYFSVLTFAIFVIVPFQAYRSLITERDQYTFELLSITTMTPGQIVRGKLSSSLVQSGLFFSAIAPFIAMTILLRGVSIPAILFLLVVSGFISAGLASLALSIGANCKNRAYQSGLTVVVLGLLLPFWGTVLSPLLFFLEESTIPFDTLGFWLGFLIYVSYYLTYFLLTLQLSVSSLTFEADNRSTSVRLCVLGIFLLTFTWAIVAIVFQWASMGFLWTDFESFLASFLVFHVLVASVLVCFESDRLSRRVHRGIERKRFRILLLPLLPGGTRGLIFCYLLLGASLGVVMSFGTAHSNYIYGIFLYAIIYVSIGSLINRIGQKLTTHYRPVLGRVLTLLFCTFAALTPYIIYAFERFEPPHVYCVTHPFATLDRLYTDQVESPTLLLILVIATLLLVTFNIPAMVQVMKETVLTNEVASDQNVTT